MRCLCLNASRSGVCVCGQVAFEVGKLYHPNVSPVDGTMCENLLTATWGPTKKATDVLAVITSFLSQPNFGACPSSPLLPVVPAPLPRVCAACAWARSGACCSVVSHVCLFCPLSVCVRARAEAVIDDDAAVVISTDIAKYEAQARRAATGARK